MKKIFSLFVLGCLTSTFSFADDKCPNLSGKYRLDSNIIFEVSQVGCESFSTRGISSSNPNGTFDTLIVDGKRHQSTEFGSPLYLANFSGNTLRTEYFKFDFELDNYEVDNLEVIQLDSAGNLVVDSSHPTFHFHDVYIRISN